MTTQLTPVFTFQNHRVRVLGTPENPLFSAADVCAILGIENSRDAIVTLDADEKITVANPDGNPRAGIPHQMAYVTESGLYALVFKSRKPEAKEFRKWVTSEVLPTIRRTGGYQVSTGGSALDYAEALVKAMREQENRLARVEALSIQANSYNSANTGFFTIRAYANILGVHLPLSEAKSIGKRASEFCRSHGILMGRARDELFGEVNSYPSEVLEEIFTPKASITHA